MDSSGNRDIGSERIRKTVGASLGLSLAAIGFLSSLTIAFAQHFKVIDSSLSDAAPQQALIPRKEVPGDAVSVEGLIHLDVTVTEQTGKPVADLKRADFKVLDNGEPQKLVAFQTSSGFPDTGEGSLRIIILVDTLDLSTKAGSRARQQVAHFLRNMPGKLRQPVMIYSLENSGFFLSADSIDPEALATAVIADNKVEAYFLAPHVHVPIKTMIASPMENFPALAGLRALWTIATAEARRPERKLLFWIGPALGDPGTGAIPPDGSALIDYKDGKLGYSTEGKKGDEVRRDIFQKISWFSTLLRQSRVTLDCFSIEESHREKTMTWMSFLSAVPSAEQATWMNLFKNILAVQSGGRVLVSSDDLTTAMNERVTNFRTFYSLTFDPPVAKQQDEYHPLKIELNRPGLTADTSVGYYDQPFYNDPLGPGARQTTIAQLEQIIERGRGGSTVRELENVVLTERLSQTKLRSFLHESHDKKLQAALQLLADQSTFLDPPAAEFSDGSPASEAEQMRIIKAAGDYLDGVIPKLPNFFATRSALAYGEVVQYPGVARMPPAQPLHLVTQTKETVLYRKGTEVVTQSSPEALALHTYGTFGPILSLLQYVLKTARDISWGWWEQGPEGRRAVFRYRISDTPQLTLMGCCYPNGGYGALTKISGNSHGEFVVDPTTGAILRIQTEYELPGFVPSKQSDTMVSYEPVTIVGTKYILPLRSVSIMRNRSVATLLAWDTSFSVYGPYETKMNVFAFDQYHMFHGDARILPGFDRVP